MRIAVTPQLTSLVEVAVVGWPDWLDAQTDPQGASGLGSFAATFIHDIWVEEHDHDGDGSAEVIGYLSYWDAGLILLDLTDPANPVFLGDSDYDTERVSCVRQSGVRIPVSVSCGSDDGRYVLMGDEDFSAYRSIATYTPSTGDPVEVQAAEGAFTTQLSTYETNPLPADLVSAGGTLCTPNGVDFTGKVALISRGDCTFQLKADNAKAQGAIGMVVYNNAGDSLVLMGGTGISDFFGFFVGQTDGLAMEAAVAAGTTSFNVENVFDGWGYLRVIDTRPGDGSGKFQEVTSFATPLVFQDPPLAGDYTMHNIVMGPSGTEFADTAFISWYSDGMIPLDASDPTDLAWTGQWIGCYGQSGCDPTLDSNGNGQAAATNFWGVYPTVIDGEVYVLGSDRNNGLVILKPMRGADVGTGLSPGGGATP